MTGAKKHLGDITRLKVKTDQKWWKRNIGIWVSLGKCLMYATNLLKERHLREIVVITKAKYLLQMPVPKFCTDSQSWFTKSEPVLVWRFQFTVGVNYRMQHRIWNEFPAVGRAPWCQAHPLVLSVWEIPFPTPGWLPSAPAGPCSGMEAAHPRLMTATSLHWGQRCWKKGRNE